MNQGDLPVFRAYTPNDLERLIREFILQLKLGHTRGSYFAQKFGVDVQKQFHEPLKRLMDWGYLQLEDDHIQLNRDGLLQVDRLLHEFFLPEHLTKRMV